MMMMMTTINDNEMIMVVYLIFFSASCLVELGLYSFAYILFYFICCCCSHLTRLDDEGFVFLGANFFGEEIGERFYAIFNEI